MRLSRYALVLYWAYHFKSYDGVERVSMEAQTNDWSLREFLSDIPKIMCGYSGFLNFGYYIQTNCFQSKICFIQKFKTSPSNVCPILPGILKRNCDEGMSVTITSILNTNNILVMLSVLEYMLRFE